MKKPFCQNHRCAAAERLTTISDFDCNLLIKSSNSALETIHLRNKFQMKRDSFICSFLNFPNHFHIIADNY